jgi:hypothetical protein
MRKILAGRELAHLFAGSTVSKWPWRHTQTATESSAEEIEVEEREIPKGDPLSWSEVRQSSHRRRRRRGPAT